MRISHAKVLFPTPGSENRLNHVLVTAHLDLHDGRKSCPFDEKVEEIKHQIGYARDGENLDTLDIGVIVLFEHREFTGLSYGLALAIADKLARFPRQVDIPVICATGRLGNKGEVLGIKQFSVKVEIAENALESSAVFAFPAENRDDALEGLGRLEAKGVSLLSVTQLDELSRLWCPISGEAASPPLNPLEAARTSFMPWFFKGMVSGFILIIATVVGLGLFLRAV